MLLTAGAPSASFWDRARGQNAQVLFDDDYGVDRDFIKVTMTLFDVMTKLTNTCQHPTILGPAKREELVQLDGRTCSFW